MAGLDLSEMVYVEAYSISTPTSNPIEARTIVSVFKTKAFRE